LYFDSPNAEEALALLSIPSPPTKSSIERACEAFLDFGVGPSGTGWVIIRSGSMGAYIASRSRPGAWIDAYWRTDERVVDVTGEFPMGTLCRVDQRLISWPALAYVLVLNRGAGNSFLGGLAAGLALTNGDVFAGT
jgi:sugar/nucleoside kinase (ribokinase family)